MSSRYCLLYHLLSLCNIYILLLLLLWLLWLSFDPFLRVNNVCVSAACVCAILIMINNNDNNNINDNSIDKMIILCRFECSVSEWVWERAEQQLTKMRAVIYIRIDKWWWPISFRWCDEWLMMITFTYSIWYTRYIYMHKYYMYEKECSSYVVIKNRTQTLLISDMLLDTFALDWKKQTMLWDWTPTRGDGK